MVRKRFNAEATKQMVHHRVADDDNLAELGWSFTLRQGLQQVGNQVADLVADEIAQRFEAARRHCEINPAHNVGAMAGLVVQRRAHAEDVAGLAVEQLRDEGRGAEVHGDTETVGRREFEPGVVRQDGRVPLCQFQLEIAAGQGATGQAPAGGDFVGGQQAGIVRGHRQFAAEHADAAAFAATVSAAWELDTLGKKEILQGSADGHAQRAAERKQFNRHHVGLIHTILRHGGRLPAAALREQINLAAAAGAGSTAASSRPMKHWKTILVAALAARLLLTTSLVTVAVWRNPHMRAVLGMASGLIVFWIGLGGGLMVWHRDRIRAAVQRWECWWPAKFVVFATALALLEEVVTTTMTNLAPLFGVKIGEAYITASTNYFDVVLLHSVVVIAPLFLAWALILWRYAFPPFAVFLLFGLTGTLMETISGGPQHLAEFAMWIFVYGLMIYLPAYCVSADRGARVPRWWLYPLAVVAPLPFITSVMLTPVQFLLRVWLFPHHPNIHFPPIH